MKTIYQSRRHNRIVHTFNSGNDEGSQLIGLVLSVLVLILLTVIALPFFMDTYGPGDDEETDTALEMTENTVDIVDNNNAHREEQYEELDLDVTYTN